MKEAPTTETPGQPTLDADFVEEAARSLWRYLTPTSLQPSRAFTTKVGCQVHLKFEGMQPTRSFKVRGALHKVIRLAPEERSSGVITASAGNHGQGVAYAARVFGIPATVYVPDGANPLKVEAIQRLGGRVVYHGRSYQEAYLEAARQQAVSGATLVHAFDDPDVIAGQGSVAVEMLRDLPEFDTVLVPVGGGGLISGVSLYLKQRLPSVRVVGVEPAGADGLARSLEERRQITLPKVSTIADGLAASGPGKHCFEIASRYVDGMIRVEDDQLLRAMRLLFEWEHVLAEPSGAAAIAALLYHYRPVPNERVVALVSGANATEDAMVKALGTR